MFAQTWQGTQGYIRELWEYRPFWMSLVKADLQRRYRRSVLGLGWSLLQPLGMTLVLGMVYRRVLNLSFVEFAPHLLTGLAFWNFFSQCLMRGCESLLGAEGYIRQQPLPLVMFPLRAALACGFHFLIALGLAFIYVLCLRPWPSVLALVTLIPSVVLFLLFGWAVATLAGFCHAYFPDTQHLAEVGLQAAVFLTPVMYPPTVLEQAGLGFLLYCNPLAILLDMIRTPLLTGTPLSPGMFGLALLVIAIPVGLAGFVVSRLERRLIFAL